MNKVFLDANVLFSAAYKANSRLALLWTLPDTALVTSAYAIEEAHRNLMAYGTEALDRFDDLLDAITVTDDTNTPLPEDIELAEKDQPILSSAISAKCSHLLTGDTKHFGLLYEKSIKGVRILTPSQYLKACTK